MNCPKCGEEIEELLAVEECYHYQLFNGKNYGDVDETYGDTTYECIKCGVELAFTEEEAKAILEDKITSEMAQRFAEIALAGEGR